MLALFSQHITGGHNFIMVALGRAYSSADGEVHGEFIDT